MKKRNKIILSVGKIKIDESKCLQELPKISLTKEQLELEEKGLLWESMGK